MSNLAKLCDDMNDYINTKGELPSSTSNSGFLNQWHNLNNQYWMDLFGDAYAVHDNTKWCMPYWLEAQVKQLVDHLNAYASQHPNVLNPPVNEMYQLPRGAYLEHPNVKKSKSIKTILWHTMMNLREEVYNPAMGIHLPNENSSIGLLDPVTAPAQTLFDWN